MVSAPPDTPTPVPWFTVDPPDMLPVPVAPRLVLPLTLVLALTRPLAVDPPLTVPPTTPAPAVPCAVEPPCVAAKDAEPVLMDP